jgi:hypothetical protein
MEYWTDIINAVREVFEIDISKLHEENASFYDLKSLPEGKRTCKERLPELAHTPWLVHNYDKKVTLVNGDILIILYSHGDFTRKQLQVSETYTISRCTPHIFITKSGMVIDIEE